MVSFVFNFGGRANRCRKNSLCTQVERHTTNQGNKDALIGCIVAETTSTSTGIPQGVIRVMLTSQEIHGSNGLAWLMFYEPRRRLQTHVRSKFIC